MRRYRVNCSRGLVERLIMGESENGERLPAGIRNAVYAMIGTATLQLFGVVYYVSNTEARFDARIGAVERDQTSFHTILDRMNDAREAQQIHMTQTDDRIADIKGKTDAILEIVQHWQETMTQGPLNPAIGGDNGGGPSTGGPKGSSRQFR